MPKAQNSKKRLILLDTHAIIHRAYHALPDFSNSRGEPTGALYGLSTMIFKIITEFKPDYIVACYDLPKPTFRHESYDAYKAGRAKTDDALVAQIERSRDFFKSFSIPIYQCEGFEADDLLGTIADKTLKQKNIDTIIASGDMDTLQLVDDEKIRVYTLKKGLNDTILYDEEKVKERFGFVPKFLPDYKGLRGDPSDNIIGIKGIGEKTATILIEKFGTIENMYKEIKKDAKVLGKLGISERILKLLEEGEEEAIFSKTLATIRKDAPIDFKLPAQTWQESIDKEKAISFFKEVEFKSLQTRFLNLIGEKNETKNENEAENKKGDDTKQKFQTLDPEKLEKAKIAYWLINSDKTDPDPSEVAGYKGSHNLNEALEKLEADIEKDKLTYIYKEIEIPIIPIIKNMEEVGIKVDTDYLKKLSSQYHKDLDAIEKNIWKLAGREFNINSPKQLGEIIFDELKIQDLGEESSKRKMKKTAGGARSTKESELEKLRDHHPIIEQILKYRELQKLLSTYIDTIPTQVASDGRLHAKFTQTGSSTGRFSSSNPNMQNIPIKSEKGKNIRHAFVAEPGYKLASFDYSQIELRIAALMSQDPYFIEVFREGRDIHAAVAMKVFGVKENEVTHNMRRQAKVINFGMLYGMGVNALRQNIGTDRKEAQAFYDNYFSQFPNIVAYLDSIKNFAKKHGYTETLFGRRRHFPAIKSPIPYIRAMAERMAINAPIQGTATADIIKIGMKNAESRLKKEGILEDCRLVLQVHDELIYEIKEDKVDQATRVIESAMKHAIPREFLANLEEVPLEVSSSSGKTWGDLKD